MDYLPFHRAPGLHRDTAGVCFGPGLVPAPGMALRKNSWCQASRFCCRTLAEGYFRNPCNCSGSPLLFRNLLPSLRAYRDSPLSGAHCIRGKKSWSREPQCWIGERRWDSPRRGRVAWRRVFFARDYWRGAVCPSEESGGSG